MDLSCVPLGLIVFGYIHLVAALSMSHSLPLLDNSLQNPDGNLQTNSVDRGHEQQLPRLSLSYSRLASNHDGIIGILDESPTFSNVISHSPYARVLFQHSGEIRLQLPKQDYSTTKRKKGRSFSIFPVYSRPQPSTPKPESVHSLQNSRTILKHNADTQGRSQDPFVSIYPVNFDISGLQHLENVTSKEEERVIAIFPASNDKILKKEKDFFERKQATNFVPSEVNSPNMNGAADFIGNNKNVHLTFSHLQRSKSGTSVHQTNKEEDSSEFQSTKAPQTQHAKSGLLENRNTYFYAALKHTSEERQKLASILKNNDKLLFPGDMSQPLVPANSEHHNTTFLKPQPDGLLSRVLMQSRSGKESITAASHGTNISTVVGSHQQYPTVSIKGLTSNDNRKQNAAVLIKDLPPNDSSNDNHKKNPSVSMKGSTFNHSSNDNYKQNVSVSIKGLTSNHSSSDNRKQHAPVYIKGLTTDDNHKQIAPVPITGLTSSHSSNDNHKQNSPVYVIGVTSHYNRWQNPPVSIKSLIPNDNHKQNASDSGKGLTPSHSSSDNQKQDAPVYIIGVTLNDNRMQNPSAPYYSLSENHKQNPSITLENVKINRQLPNVDSDIVLPSTPSVNSPHLRKTVKVVPLPPSNGKESSSLFKPSVTTTTEYFKPTTPTTPVTTYDTAQRKVLVRQTYSEPLPLKLEPSYIEEHMHDMTFVPAATPKSTSEKFECVLSKWSYSLPHSEYCDSYWHCEQGVATLQRCDDGLVYNVKTEMCVFPFLVNCTGRPLFHPSKPSRYCLRQNGLFAIKGRCSQFYMCSGGRHVLMFCSPGLVFDPRRGACDFPELAYREGCLPEQLYGVHCPSAHEHSYTESFGHLMRLAHPKSCRYFFQCLQSSQPRLQACEKPLVFNPETGICDNTENVKGCENFYIEQDTQIKTESHFGVL